MKYLATMAMAAVCGMAGSSCSGAQDEQIQVGAPSVVIGDAYQFTNYGSDAYGRRLNRYQNNYGYNNYGYNGNRQYRNSGQFGYRNHDYYGGNYGRVRGYQNHYRSYPNRGYNNGYYSRPGFSIGGGSSRVYFGF